MVDASCSGVYFSWEDVNVCKNNTDGFDEARTRLRKEEKVCPGCQKGIDELEVFYFSSPPGLGK
jgi:hypothetical protein